MTVAIVIVVLLVLILLPVIYGFSTYNGLVRLRNLVQEAWQQIDVELKRRHDLIPNLVETVKGYASHERGTLEEVMRARSSAMSGNLGPAGVAQSEGQLTQALGRLFAVAEAYPDLKANQNFLALQQELSATEDRIAAGRRYYNANVRELNTKVETAPSNIIAGLFHIGRAEYFEAEAAAREAPSISFGGSASGAAAAGGLASGGSAPGIESGSAPGIGSVPGTSLPPVGSYPQDTPPGR